MTDTETKTSEWVFTIYDNVDRYVSPKVYTETEIGDINGLILMDVFIWFVRRRPTKVTRNGEIVYEVMDDGSVINNSIQFRNIPSQVFKTNLVETKLENGNINLKVIATCIEVNDLEYHSCYYSSTICDDQSIKIIKEYENEVITIGEYYNLPIETANSIRPILEAIVGKGRKFILTESFKELRTLRKGGTPYTVDWDISGEYDYLFDSVFSFSGMSFSGKLNELIYKKHPRIKKELDLIDIKQYNVNAEPFHNFTEFTNLNDDGDNWGSSTHRYVDLPSITGKPTCLPDACMGNVQVIDISNIVRDVNHQWDLDHTNAVDDWLCDDSDESGVPSFIYSRERREAILSMYNLSHPYIVEQLQNSNMKYIHKLSIDCCEYGLNFTWKLRVYGRDIEMGLK